MNKSVGLLTIAFGADLRGFDRAMKKAQRKDIRRIDALWTKIESKMTEEEKASWRKPGTQPTHPVKRGFYAVKEYWLCQDRWRNSFNDFTGDHTHGINTDHFPLIAKIKIELS